MFIRYICTNTYTLHATSAYIIHRPSNYKHLQYYYRRLITMTTIAGVTNWFFLTLSSTEPSLCHFRSTTWYAYFVNTFALAYSFELCFGNTRTYVHMYIGGMIYVHCEKWREAQREREIKKRPTVTGRWYMNKYMYNNRCTNNNYLKS